LQPVDQDFTQALASARGHDYFPAVRFVFLFLMLGCLVTGLVGCASKRAADAPIYEGVGPKIRYVPSAAASIRGGS
jgi:hypothetical protein